MLLRNCLLKHIIGGKIKGEKDKEELSNCWITLREQENNRARKREH